MDAGRGDDLVALVGDPFAFVRLYRDVAEVASTDTHRFTDGAIEGLHALEIVATGER